MIWLVWRRQRAAILFASVLMAGVAVLLLATGLGGPPPVRTSGPPTGVMIARLILLVLPGVVGVILGAGLFGRELEQGTHVFALTQNVGRLRWWATGLLVAGLPAALATAGLTRLADWALGPAGLWFPLSTPFFDGSGLLPVAHLVVAFTVSAAAGLLARNALAAVAVGVGVLLVAQIVLPAAFRPSYAAPVTTRADAGILDSAPVRTGRAVDLRYLGPDGRPVDRLIGPCLPGERAACLRERGVEQVEVAYQPASRYWAFQGIEAAALGGLAVIAVAAGWWGLRRRVW